MRLPESLDGDVGARSVADAQRSNEPAIPPAPGGRIVREPRQGGVARVEPFVPQVDAVTGDVQHEHPGSVPNEGPVLRDDFLGPRRGPPEDGPTRMSVGPDACERPTFVQIRLKEGGSPGSGAASRGPMNESRSASTRSWDPSFLPFERRSVGAFHGATDICSESAQPHARRRPTFVHRGPHQRAGPPPPCHFRGSRNECRSAPPRLGDRHLCCTSIDELLVLVVAVAARRSMAGCRSPFWAVGAGRLLEGVRDGAPTSFPCGSSPEAEGQARNAHGTSPVSARPWRRACLNPVVHPRPRMSVPACRVESEPTRATWAKA